MTPRNCRPTPCSWRWAKSPSCAWCSGTCVRFHRCWRILSSFFAQRLQCTTAPAIRDRHRPLGAAAGGRSRSSMLHRVPKSDVRMEWIDLGRVALVPVVAPGFLPALPSGHRHHTAADAGPHPMRGPGLVAASVRTRPFPGRGRAPDPCSGPFHEEGAHRARHWRGARAAFMIETELPMEACFPCRTALSRCGRGTLRQRDGATVRTGHSPTSCGTSWPAMHRS